MKAAEQVILRDLSKKLVKFRKLLKTELGIGSQLGGEIRYALQMKAAVFPETTGSEQD